MATNHWLIRVGDGKNFRKSKLTIWGVKKCHKGMVNKFKPGDILWFLVNQDCGGKIIGMAEFTNFYDRKDEPFIQMNTITNSEQGWEGDSEFDIQIHYKNLYNTEKQNIKICLKGRNTILNYEIVKSKIKDDLVLHYNNYKFYAEILR